jgi:hypothetical protein
MTTIRWVTACGSDCEGAGPHLQRVTRRNAVSRGATLGL